MPTAGMSTIKDRRGLSLPPKITVSVYWALMLAGLIVAPIVLRDLERELTAERGRQADLPHPIPGPELLRHGRTGPQ